MRYNSKLTGIQKEILKNMREYGDNVHILHADRVTFAYVIEGDFVKFATSICSPLETKFRKKVGEYHARSRFQDGDQWAMLPHQIFNDMIRDNFHDFA